MQTETQKRVLVRQIAATCLLLGIVAKAFKHRHDLSLLSFANKFPDLTETRSTLGRTD